MQFDNPGPADPEANHPLAERMGVIAGFSHNIVVGGTFGTFGVMLASSQQRLHISLEDAWLGLPLVIGSSSLCAVLAGIFVARLSLQRMLTLGALLTLAAFLLLALTSSYPLYLVAYGLLLGPAIAINGIVGTATLVTRWFRRNRGLALGLAHMPILATFLPIITNWMQATQGPQAAYLLPAGLAAVLVPLTLLATDSPPAHDDPVGQAAAGRGAADERDAVPELGLAGLVRRLRLWALAASAGTVSSGAMLMSMALVPLVMSFGMGRPQAAALAAILSVAGIAGAIGFGWIVDRIGGARTLALLCLDLALLWSALLTQPGFGPMAIVVGLLGLHAGGLVPALGRGLSDAFGAASFSRAFGLATTLSLPMILLAVIGTSRVFQHSGTFAPVIPAMAAVYGAGFFAALLAKRLTPAAPSPSLAR